MDWFLYDRDLRHERVTNPKEQGYADVYSEPNQTSKMELFVKIAPS